MGVVSLSAFGGQYAWPRVDPGHSQRPLSGGCPLLGRPPLGGSKCTIHMVRSIGGIAFVRCTEVVRFSESPLLEVSLYIICGGVCGCVNTLLNSIYLHVCVCVCICVCVCACVCMWGDTCMCLFVFVFVLMCVWEWGRDTCTCICRGQTKGDEGCQNV